MSLRIVCSLLLTIPASAVAADTSGGTSQGRLVFLDIRGRVLTADPDGSPDAWLGTQPQSRRKVAS